jgi:DNA (cytosine-5)-methyltransferase 1
MTFYNENDPGAVEWLGELQSRGLIAKGDIDGRSIEELRAEDCGPTSHFFAGIGGWAYALQLAGWDPARDVWTGSCPCQPFSQAAGGSAKGFGDKRHLWPVWRELIAEYRPAVVFGEQVASKLGREWLSGVRADLEELGYAVGAADLCAAGVNAPHRRQRLYWVAYTGHGGDMGRGGLGDAAAGVIGEEGADQAVGLGGSEQAGFRAFDDVADGGEVGVDLLVDPLRGGASDQDAASEPRGYREEDGVPGTSGLPDFWDQFDIAECRGVDGSVQYRRIGPGVLPVADGVPERVGRIRGYGNAIVPQVAATFITAFMEAAGYMPWVARSGWALDIWRDDEEVKLPKYLQGKNPKTLLEVYEAI